MSGIVKYQEDASEILKESVKVLNDAIKTCAHYGLKVDIDSHSILDINGEEYTFLFARVYKRM